LLCIIVSAAEEKGKQSKRIWKFIQGEAKEYHQPSLPQECENVMSIAMK
jgi:hypothetical protein